MLGKYKRQYFLRLPLNAYSPHKVETNYIFHVSTLWQSNVWVNNDESVNKLRAMFMDTCKSIKSINFEGGFYYNGKHGLNKSFEHLIFKKFMNVAEYIQKTRQSTLVFNTPAWLNCKGWKLGEYLALGKAIISTDLQNEMPESLVHGENIHFVAQDLHDLKDSILLICNNKKYREKLSNGAHNYHLRNCTPAAVIKKLCINVV